jgi:hypothetical protein
MMMVPDSRIRSIICAVITLKMNYYCWSEEIFLFTQITYYYFIIYVGVSSNYFLCSLFINVLKADFSFAYVELDAYPLLPTAY